ncbi:MAG: CYTH domain-containing protein [Candidatus Microsaccharimonas sp.]
MATFEVEKKFRLTETQQQILLDNATFVGEKVIVDSYFDDDSFSLTLNGNWLRLRDGAFELKAPFAVGAVSESGVIRFREITDYDLILKELNLKPRSSFEESLEKAGIKAFVTCHTTRRTYKKDGFTIDIDTATYDDSEFTFSIAEIEKLVNSEEEADEADAEIIAFAKQHSLSTNDFILGKIAAFIQVENPRHYDMLIEAGILK